jgi:sulfatase modifying factor 1
MIRKFLIAILILGLISYGKSSQNAINPENLVFIPAGWFWMGEDDGRFSNQPMHQVYLDEYYIMKTEVTIQEFGKYIKETGYITKGWTPELAASEGNLPVTNIVWKDAEAYCQWAGMRLPTEAEWEKAARGDDSRHFPWGDTWDVSLANTYVSDQGHPMPVGSYPQGASPYGVLDMCGNVIEWVADYFDFTAYDSAIVENRTGSTQPMDHGLRGGSYDSPADQVTTYFRDSSHSVMPNSRVGFRCAMRY